MSRGRTTAGLAVRPLDRGGEPLSQTPPDIDESQTSATAGRRNDAVDDWGVQSFPASDPPQNW